MYLLLNAYIIKKIIKEEQIIMKDGVLHGCDHRILFHNGSVQKASDIKI